jgi:hypothetical protein
MGRRRIGKSALVEEFGVNYKRFVNIQGLGPNPKKNNEVQLKHFAERLSEIFNIRESIFTDWSQAFMTLAKLTAKGEVLIFLDEISWMGEGDDHFSLKLKEAWDIAFKKNPKLILVACGSISSWIEENILKNSSFEGRVSCSLVLDELKADEITEYWDKNHFHFGLAEKMLLLSITGGVPKYFEEINPKLSLDENIVRLCFRKEGLLFNDFENIFHEIFNRKTKVYEKIVRLLLDNKYSLKDLAKKLKMEQSGQLSEAIHHLELSGFLRRDFYFKADGKISKFSHLRVRDNYLRFYLKVIAPLKPNIQKGGMQIKSLNDIKNIASITGYQFENFILFNQLKMYEKLSLSASQIISSAPHYQMQDKKGRKACQIDLLIHAEKDVFYLCEFKTSHKIGHQIIQEVEEKCRRIKLPKRCSVRPVLIHLNELDANHEEKIKNYFFRTISFSDFIS